MERLPEIETTANQACNGRAHAAGESGLDSAGAQNRRLQMLVCELLEENQRLRIRVTQLEQQAASAERGLASATLGAGALF